MTSLFLFQTYFFQDIIKWSKLFCKYIATCHSNLGNQARYISRYPQNLNVQKIFREMCSPWAITQQIFMFFSVQSHDLLFSVLLFSHMMSSITPIPFYVHFLGLLGHNLLKINTATNPLLLLNGTAHRSPLATNSLTIGGNQVACTLPSNLISSPQQGNHGYCILKNYTAYWLKAIWFFFWKGTIWHYWKVICDSYNYFTNFPKFLLLSCCISAW